MITVSRCQAACLGGLALGLQLAAAAGAESLDASRERAVRAATFEVVMRRPQADPLGYERELPLDRLPYGVRNDPFIPVGTAFAIGANEFVTAAHVLSAAFGSLYGAPSLRDSAGRTYAVWQVLKYSGHEDFAVVSVADPPPIRPLPAAREFSANQPVHAVGNAFGEGIVIRSGLSTSTTPEDVAGRWDWLRFSAAASPGNSGGPLLDERGRVLGVIIAASPNENLNFALPIERVLKGSAVSGGSERRVSFAHPGGARPIPGDIRIEIPLPADFTVFAAAYDASWTSQLAALREKWLATHGDSLFPRGEAAGKLMRYDLISGRRLKLMKFNSNDAWELAEATGQYFVALEERGRIDVGTVPHATMLSVQLPEKEPLDRPLSDSAAHGVYFARGLQLSRPVGDQNVKITALGPAMHEARFRDDWGRTWIERHWPLPFADLVLVTLTLPLPDGFVALTNLRQPPDATGIGRDLRDLAQLVAPLYAAPLKRWREFVAMSEFMPAPLARMEFTLEDGAAFGIVSPRFRLRFDPTLQRIDADSFLSMNLGYFRDRGTAVWDVNLLSVAEERDPRVAVSVIRRQPPVEDASATSRDEWQAILEGAPPYDGEPRAIGPATAWASVHGFGLKDSSGRAAYVVTYTGVQPTVDAEEVGRRGRKLREAFEVLE